MNTIKLELNENLFNTSVDLIANPQEIFDYIIDLYPDATNIDIIDSLEESNGIVYTVLFNRDTN